MRRHMAHVNIVTYFSTDGTRCQQWFYARQRAREFASIVHGAIHQEWIALAAE